MIKDRAGYWKTAVGDAFPGTLYLYNLEEAKERPDPASQFQPQGVHRASQVVDHSSFNWEDGNWKGIDISRMIIYELHVCAFTPAGTFDAIIPRLGEIKEVGINAIEIMPVAQFPGERNWGYDGVYPFAVQNSYGGPDGLKRLVNECHKQGVSVILDVVYNHLGPEGNYFADYGPYFTEKYKTPWGSGLNFDGPYSDDVRNFFIENAIYWFDHYHIDALRLDAVHAIFDMSARPFLLELAERTQQFSKKQMRKFYLIAENDLNDTKVIRSRELGGCGIDAQWCDDFHHCLHTLLTGEDQGYYCDFGAIEHLVKSLREGFTYSGQYSKYRNKRQGNSCKDRQASQFVVFSQNHDQIGNRMLGERLSSLVSYESLKLAASAVILSPFIPLIYMGEEYGETAAFLYFTSHSDPGLIEGVRAGRREEFKEFAWQGEPPDPQSVETFLKSKLDWEKREKGNHRVLLNFYKALIKLRREVPAISNLDKDSLDAFGFEQEKVIFLRRWKDASQAFCLLNFNAEDVRIKAHLPDGNWAKALDSSEKIWSGPGTFLPKTITPGVEVILRGRSSAMYIRQD